MKRTLTILILYFFILPCFSQDTIVGIYGSYENDFLGEEVVFRNDQSFKFVSKMLNLGQPIIGKWNKLNDSTYIIDVDSNSVFTVKYRQLKFKLSNDSLIFLFQLPLDSSVTKLYYKKKVGFYSNDTLKYEIKYFSDYEIKTNYYSNGKISEIIEYKKGIKDGIYLKYNTQGRITILQKWKKGKMIIDKNFLYDKR